MVSATHFGFVSFRVRIVSLSASFRVRIIPLSVSFHVRIIPFFAPLRTQLIPRADHSTPPPKPFCRRIISQRPSDRCTTKTKNPPENRRKPPFFRVVAQPRLLRLQNDPPPSSNPAAPKHETAEKHSGTSTKSGRLIFCCRKPRHQSKKVAELCAARASAMQK